MTDAAVRHLDGRPLVLRASPRHGCCGGHALMPVAEVGPPEDGEDYTVVVADGGITCIIDPRLLPDVDRWTVDAVGLSRWRRLHLDGATLLDPFTDGSLDEGPG